MPRHKYGVASAELRIASNTLHSALVQVNGDIKSDIFLMKDY